MELVKDLGTIKKGGDKYRRWGIYLCPICSQEFDARTDNVNSKRISSCGCVGKVHGLSSHRLYDTWTSMIARCYNPKSLNYKWYGAVGITVCDEWRGSPITFIQDMGPSFIEGLTLDRVDGLLK